MTGRTHLATDLAGDAGAVRFTEVDTDRGVVLTRAPDPADRASYAEIAEHLRPYLRASKLRELGVDPDQHPAGGLLEHDPATNEWRVEVTTTGGRRVILRRVDPRRRWYPAAWSAYLAGIGRRLDRMVLGDRGPARSWHNQPRLHLVDDPLPDAAASAAFRARAAEWHARRTR